jgi:hypothetical protein|tara:strand:- start:506 stop:919 length:414 start_codon:yes stop_codon:yes gene_type:complete
MAVLTITDSDVAYASGGSQTHYEAGEVIDAGEVCYIKAADGKAYLAINNVDDASATVKGFAVSSALKIGQFVSLSFGASIISVTSSTAGVPYYLASTAGKIFLESDIATGHRVCQVAVGAADNKLNININNSLVVAV